MGRGGRGLGNQEEGLAGQRAEAPAHGTVESLRPLFLFRAWPGSALLQGREAT